MARGHPWLPRPKAVEVSKKQLLEQLSQIDQSGESRARVLRLESAFRRKIKTHIDSLPSEDAVFKKFATSPYVLLIHTFNKRYTKISELESDILPAKQFSSMETSAGRMVEEVVLPEYGWQIVPSEMHSTNSALDGRRVEEHLCRVATLKSGPRCLNDEMSENFADTILSNFTTWAEEAGTKTIDFTYGVLYGTPKQSNKKDWHILRNIAEKTPESITDSPEKKMVLSVSAAWY